MKQIKYFVLAFSTVLFTQMGHAQQIKTSNPENEITELKAEMSKLKKSLQEKEVKLKSYKKDIDNLTTRNQELKTNLNRVESSLNAFKSSMQKTLTEVNESFGTKIDSTSVQILENKASVDKGFQTVFLYGVSGILLAIIISFIIFYILKKRIGKGNVDIDSVKEANKKLSEQSIALDNRLAEVLERQLKTDESIRNFSTQTNNTEKDHSLVLSIANEMMRIEQNLSFMDPKTKGVSQLRHRATAIAALLNSKGYEIPNLVNTEYKEGMNFEAVMEEDEDMEPGIMRIKRVTQPCVMYQGKMIQAAKVVVAFNPDGAE